jgi:hypothetical protein
MIVGLWFAEVLQFVHVCVSILCDYSPKFIAISHARMGVSEDCRLTKTDMLLRVEKTGVDDAVNLLS